MPKTFIRILDLDLDFFILPTDWPGYHDDRAMNDLQSWSEIDVKRFLENSCGLSKDSPVKGKVFEEHDEVYSFCKKIIQDSAEEVQFIIDHVDAHADLGFGNSSFNKLHREFSPGNRSGWITEELEKSIGLNRGNFLLFLIAQGWVFELNFINHAKWNFHDINQILIFKREDRCNCIRIQYYEDCSNVAANKQEDGMSIGILGCDFHKIDYRLFNNPHRYDYVFLTKSPNYSPPSSDSLIPTIEQYIDTTANIHVY